MATEAPSGDGRRLTLQGRERKQRLLDEAATLFATRGYAETRVVDICEAAGAAKGLFYWYFENKEALFQELATDIRLRLRRAQGRAIDPGADPLTRIRQGTRASLVFMAEHATFFALLEVENREQRFAEILRGGSDVHRSDVLALIEQGQAAGLVRSDPADLLAWSVVGTVAHFSHLHRTGRLELAVDDLAEFVADLVVRSLAADVPAPRG